MDERMKFFDLMADGWEKRFYDSPGMSENLDRNVSLYGLNPGMTILDAGCGTGVIFGRLNDLTGRRGRVFGVDFSSVMIECARRAYPKNSDDLICADVHRLPFDKGYFDAVVCFSSFPHFVDKIRAVAEAARVLKPGGLFIVSHLCSSRKIAAIHKRAHPSVSEDHLPSKSSFVSILKHSALTLLEYTDRSDIFLVRAVK